MIQVSIQNPNFKELIYKAFLRSFTEGLVSVSPSLSRSSLLVTDTWSPDASHAKVIIFGPKPALVAGQLLGSLQNDTIYFNHHELTRTFHLQTRAFERFDFTNEWNNLGYGRIEKNGVSAWSLNDPSALEYAMLWDTPKQSILWVNRNVGPIDGFDWRMVEDFISDYRHSELTTLPVLSEIPAGFRGAVTMRIDCDEAITSGKPLFELYRSHGLPFSMAIKTLQHMGPEEIQVMKDVIAAGGSILTHSHTHAPNWSGSADKAEWEVDTSLKILKNAIPEYSITYAVSPFHQNPPYAIEGIRNAGIEGFVGGIIHNDPEYLMARGGGVPFVDGIVSHSEQCMLHGDCYHDARNSIQIYVDAFLSAFKTETFFGYLDHPFSTYQYGWTTEAERLQVHDLFLKEIIQERDLWFASTRATLDFFWDRNQVRLFVVDGELNATHTVAKRSSQKFKIRWKHASTILS